MKKRKEVSVIYVYYNTPFELAQSIASVEENSKGIGLEIIVVDNDSPKKIPKTLEKKKNIKIIKNKKNVGFGKGCNIGAMVAQGEYLLFLNPDTVVSKSAISEMLKTLRKKNIGIVGPKMLDEDGNTLPTINSFLTFRALFVVYSFFNTMFKKNPISKRFWLYDLDRDKEQKVDVLSGACLMLKRTTFEKVEGFDERFFMYFEEQDLCSKIKRNGLAVVFNPKAKIIHLIGRSLSEKKKIQKYFQESRFLYAKKYFGLTRALVSEFFLRYLISSNIVVGMIFALSLFLNTYRQDSLMLLIGDAARDFLAARDMIMTHNIPLVGIPSSVPWLHQGPISVYGIGFAFLLSKFNPVGPGILFGFVGAVTTAMLYFFVKKYQSDTAAFIASILYATSPMVVVNARMPYHTSLIPFFSVLFFFIFTVSLKKPRMIPLVFFAFGLLMQVELSNVIVLAIIAIVFYSHKIKFGKNILFLSGITFFLGILPFVLYEFVNGPAYIKFPLWIANRIRLFFGLTMHHSSTTSSLPNALFTIYQQISGTIFPNTHLVGLFVFLVAFLFLILGTKGIIKKSYLFVLLLWIVVPLFSFSLHTSPGTAYFGLLYPAILILVAFLFDALVRVNKLFLFLILFIALFNSVLLVKNDFFVSSKNGAHPMPPTFYNFGTSWKLSDDVAKAIVLDAGGRNFRLIGKGGLSLYKTSIDTYVYLVWYRGGKISRNATVTYEVYSPGAINLTRRQVVFNGEGGVVVKNE